MKNSKNRTGDDLHGFEDLVFNTQNYLNDDFPNGVDDKTVLVALLECVESNDDIYPEGQTTDQMVVDAFYEILGIDRDASDPTGARHQVALEEAMEELE